MVSYGALAKQAITIGEDETVYVDEATQPEGVGDGLLYFVVVLVIVALLGFLYYKKHVEEQRIKKIIRRTKR